MAYKPLFESLDDALDDFDNYFVYDIDWFLKRYEIVLHYTDTLTDNINGYSIPMTHSMFINERSPEQNFVKYHEFIHCLLDDNSEPLIETSYMLGSKIEHRADIGALCVMIKEYALRVGLEPNEFSVMQFQESFGLPSKYQYDIAYAAEKSLGIRINL